MAAIEVKVPDIGDFKDVGVIELLVKPGDAVQAEQSLITVESDKASMEIPSSTAGVVKELRVKVGDKVSEGSVILVVEAGGAAAPAPAPNPVRAEPPTVRAEPVSPTALSLSKGAPSPKAPQASAGTFAGKADIECEMLVLGAGPGGSLGCLR